MSKDILTRPINLFRNDVLRINSASLKQLLSGLQAFGNKFFRNFKGKDDFRYSQAIDLERKKTIITGELQRRKFLTKKDTNEFHKWLFKQHDKGVF